MSPSNPFVNGHQEQKVILLQFWSRFDRHSRGDRQAKIAALKEMAAVKIQFKRQEPVSARREKFNAVKHELHKMRIRRNLHCFACGRPSDARHHIIQLQHGGINSRKNLVSLCNACHAEIHPWLTPTLS